MTEETTVRMVDVGGIRIPSFQVRESALDLEDLKLSVEKLGLIEPIILRESAEGFELVAGYRRLSAVKAAGQMRIPALIRKLSDLEAFRIQVGENIGREDLTEQEKTLKKQLPAAPLAAGLKETLEEEITFLIIPPALGEHSIPLTKKKLKELFVLAQYAESGLTKRVVTQTPAGLTVTFSLVEWLKYNSDIGASSGSMNNELFEAELKSTLCRDSNFDPDEVDQYTVKQLHPTEPAVEKPAKPVKEIDFERVGKNCPACGRPISPEAYEHIKKRYGEKYPELFQES